jgi:hypothetical protein
MTPPLAESIYWHFPILIVTVSLIYSATRFERWGQILHEALVWGGRMTLFLAAIGVVLFLISALDWPVWALVAIAVVILAIGYVASSYF